MRALEKESEMDLKKLQEAMEIAEKWADYQGEGDLEKQLAILAKALMDLLTER